MTNDLGNVRVNENKNALLLHLITAEVEVLVCRADRTTKLLLNQANVNRGFQYQKLSESKVLVCKVIVRKCVAIVDNTKMFLTVNVFKLEVKCHGKEIFNLLSYLSNLQR